MGISLVTFAGSTVTPQDDALIYETALTGSGLIYGGAVTIKNANTLHVATAHGALCGRKFTIEETDIAVSLTPSGSLLGRVYIHMDLPDTDEPIQLLIETAETLTPVVQDADVNITNGVYEINLATFTVDTSTLDNLVNEAPTITPMDDLIDGVYKTSDQTETAVAAADSIPFFDDSAGTTKKIQFSNFLGVGSTGTASATGTRYQYVKVGGSNKEILGSKYMENSSYTTSGSDRVFTFTNVSQDAVIDGPYCDKIGVAPTAQTHSGTTYTVSFATSDAVTKVRIYLK